MIISTIIRAFRTLSSHGPSTSENHASNPVGLVILADGIGGLDLCGHGMRRALAAADAKLELRVIRWGHGYGRWHADLSNVANHQTQASEIANQARRFREEHPDAPVYLVGKSGGTAVILHALGRLEPDSIEAAILLAPAVSPDYDLSQALTAAKRLVVYWSPLDVVILGLGTSMFGTADRRWASAAGMVGFRMPSSASRLDLYNERLEQVKWKPEMAASGYFGGHIGPDNPAFLRKYVLPHLGVPFQERVRSDDEAPSAVKPLE